MSWGNAWGTRSWGGGSIVQTTLTSTGSVTANAVHLRLHVLSGTPSVGRSYILTPGFIPIA